MKISLPEFKPTIKKGLSLLILCAFLVNTALPAYAQSAFVLPVPGEMVELSAPFTPPLLKAIKVDPDDPFAFNFIVDSGSDKMPDNELKTEADKLIRYFLASLTTPENDLWVNLSPYEKNRIIPQSFGVTEMGRDLLAQDYILKQITATLMYPEKELGKKFWDKVYQKAYEKFGTNDMMANTFNKVWIVPQEAIVYENGMTAYISETRLKVMLEEDYQALEHSTTNPSQVRTDVNSIGAQVVREIIIPELEKEVNEGTHFASLRQVYNSLILANWYKKRLKDSILAKMYVDKNKVGGVDIDDKAETQKIYGQYVDAFQKGVYNYIREDIDRVSKEPMPRKYFSGGMDWSASSALVEFRQGMPPEADNKAHGRFVRFTVVLNLLRGKGKEMFSLPRGGLGNIAGKLKQMAAALGAAMALAGPAPAGAVAGDAVVAQAQPKAPKPGVANSAAKNQAKVLADIKKLQGEVDGLAIKYPSTPSTLKQAMEKRKDIEYLIKSAEGFLEFLGNNPIMQGALEVLLDELKQELGKAKSDLARLALDTPELNAFFERLLKAQKNRDYPEIVRLSKDFIFKLVMRGQEFGLSGTSEFEERISDAVNTQFDAYYQDFVQRFNAIAKQKDPQKAKSDNEALLKEIEDLTNTAQFKSTSRSLQTSMRELNDAVKNNLNKSKDDKPVLPTSSSTDTFGGIDFKADRQNIKIRGNYAPIPLNIDLPKLRNIQFDGLFPVIINMVPVGSLPLFLSQVVIPSNEKIAKTN